MVQLVFRVMRVTLGEWLGDVWLGFKNPHISAIISMGLTMLLVLSGTWIYLWQLFGASNQLMAALSLLIVSLWLKSMGRSPRFAFWPMLFMYITTMAAIVVTAYNLYASILSNPTIASQTDQPAGSSGDDHGCHLVVRGGVDYCLRRLARLGPDKRADAGAADGGGLSFKVDGPRAGEFRKRRVPQMRAAKVVATASQSCSWFDALRCGPAPDLGVRPQLPVRRRLQPEGARKPGTAGFSKGTSCHCCCRTSWLDRPCGPGLASEDFDLQLGNGTQLGTNNQQIASAAEARQQPQGRNIPGFHNHQDFDAAERLAGIFDLEVDDRRTQPAQAGLLSDYRQAALQPFQEAMALAYVQVGTKREPADDGDDNYHEDG